MDFNDAIRRRGIWGGLETQYDTHDDRVARAGHDERRTDVLPTSYGYQYSIPSGPQGQLQNPEYRESPHTKHAENTLEAPIENPGLKDWQLSVQPLDNPTSSLTSNPARSEHENMYHPTYDYRYPTTCDVLFPQQYAIAPAVSGVDEQLLPFNPLGEGWDGKKLADEALDFSGLDFDLNSFPPEFLFPEENLSIINLRKQPLETDIESYDARLSRRPSASSFSLSSTGAAPPFDIAELSGYPEVPPYSAEYTPRSSLALSSTPLSPLLSPRCPQPDVSRVATRSRASPSPRPSMRTAPYTLDGGRKRWSTGSYGSPSARRSSFSHHNADGQPQQPANASRYSLPSTTLRNLAPTNLTSSSNGNNKPARFHRNSYLLPSNFDNNSRFGKPMPLASQGPFRTLDSNAGSHSHSLDHYTDLSDPPDLLGPLKEKQVSPPPEDMNPKDPDLVPHEQELRFDNDLYTPKWVRGHGNKREGWCGICKPGRWLVLKNSAFWYDKSFTHGISAATGQAFEAPEKTRRMEGSSEVWEGLCRSCGEWVALVSSKKKGTTWFRHAYKCHIHPKVKDAPKRNRESSARGRPSSANSSAKALPPPPSMSAAPAEPKPDPVTPTPSTAAIVGDNALPGVKTVSPLQCISSMI